MASRGRIGRAENLLTELHAILVYLARTNTAAALLPEDPAAEARCIEWINWLASSVHAMSYGQIWRTQLSQRVAAGPAVARVLAHEEIPAF